MCDGYQYTFIFFKQGLMTQYNQDLNEIHDPAMIAQFKNHYDYNFS